MKSLLVGDSRARRHRPGPIRVDRTRSRPPCLADRTRVGRSGPIDLQLGKAIWRRRNHSVAIASRTTERRRLSAARGRSQDAPCDRLSRHRVAMAAGAGDQPRG